MATLTPDSILQYFSLFVQSEVLDQYLLGLQHFLCSGMTGSLYSCERCRNPDCSDPHRDGGILDRGVQSQPQDVRISSKRFREVFPGDVVLLLKRTLYDTCQAVFQ
jgi:hypothetical protein